jgi:hypothetical protein
MQMQTYDVPLFLVNGKEIPPTNKSKHTPVVGQQPEGQKDASSTKTPTPRKSEGMNGDEPALSPRGGRVTH